jgi:NitT/TauT family transport system ATP-binding protein
MNSSIVCLERRPSPTFPSAPATAAPPPRRQFELSAVDFDYGAGRPVFSGLDLSVAAGEFVVLIGPSGCGKTTLLDLLSGFARPRRGSVRLDGRAVDPGAPELGYVFQAPNLFPWLSALENTRFGLRMAGRLPRHEQVDRAREALALVGLAGAEDKLPHELSGGMQQRVALARTLVMKPQVLLMDEPFAALDALTRRDMNEELLRLWQELGQSVVFITHDIDEAVFLADRVVVLAKAPGGIHSELAIDLPRPRTQRETRTHPGFAAYGAELMDRIVTVSGAPVAAPLPQASAA